MSPKYLLTGLICLFLVAGCRNTTDVPPATITSTITQLHEAGNITAANTVTINGPSGWGGAHRITWMMPEGTQVAAGDTILLFDTVEFDTYIQQNVDDLEAKRLAVTSAHAQGAANHTRTSNSIDKAHLASEMAQLDLEHKRFESQTVREGAKLAGRQAEIDLLQARRSDLAQATLDSLVIAQASLELVKQEARVRRLQTYRDQMTVAATSAGMVVYHRQYTDEGVKVYREGDEVRRQAPVLEITDTSAMKVTFAVHEKDRWRLDQGQTVQVILDAYPDTSFNGTIEIVSRMPLATVDGSVARRFEATAIIFENDPRLKPGMSARVIIELGGSP